MFGLSRHPVSHYGQHANYAPVTSHPDFAVFPHETVCKPSSLLPELRSIRTRLSQLQTMIYGQEHRRALDNIQKTNSSRLDTEHLHTTDGILAAGRRRNLERSYTANQHEACISCARCALRVHYVPRHSARMKSDSTQSSASVQEALKRMSLLRETTTSHQRQ